jgi:hypothetical protein
MIAVVACVFFVLGSLLLLARQAYREASEERGDQRSREVIIRAIGGMLEQRGRKARSWRLLNEFVRGEEAPEEPRLGC